MKQEARLQAWADRFIDRVVLPPMFTTALEHGAQEYANNVRRAAAFQARGGKFGLPDCLVIQGSQHRSTTWSRPQAICFIEYKRGNNDLSSRQHGISDALERVGVPVLVCRSIKDVYNALRASSFDLHANAMNIVAEYEERLAGADRTAAAKRKAA